MTAPRQGALATPRILETVETPAGETLTVKEAITQAFRAGSDQATAATWAGIHPATLSRWLRNGDAIWLQLDETAETQPAATETPDDPLSNLSAEDRAFLDLTKVAAGARAFHRMRLVANVTQAADGDWRAAEKALAALDRGSWAPTPRVEVAGPVGGPVGLDDRKLDDRTAADLVAVLEARHAAALPVAEVG